MAWRSSGRDNESLIENLKQNNIIHHPRVVAAMKSVDRGKFAPNIARAYEDSPQPIGYGATISAPHMHGYMLEELEQFLRPGMKVLDIGAGSGYLSACMAHLVGPEGLVIAVEHIEELASLARENIRADHADWLTQGRVEVHAGDGRLGYASKAPYDAIHVGAAAPVIPPALIEQLKVPGRMVIPVGTIHQDLYRVDKSSSGNVEQRELMGVLFVPLTDKHEQVKD
ncbi:Pcmt1-prov protein [Gonapodya prolifera JEL478]|uniref:Protein-L-isoaspartate O-methyltransferase n=1 Tax=Gonapodya prolifera (strain JEL478) TaxID=1344416 RepID=A0A139A9T2_GONPJ|nr:Pcmt1-prov protein [Gonapodya prolifera JEL478]|eukprot:KXS13536.1 Pcmt1-prov protein [Gonapodya prolifera JEL478]